MIRPPKIAVGEMRASGVRGVLTGMTFNQKWPRSDEKTGAKV